MKVIALVGETGTGKSTIASYLEKRGARVIDADGIAHRLLENDPAIRKSLRERFGSGVFREDGSVDRAELGKIVFENPEDLSFLNGTLHPAVLRESIHEIEKFRNKGENLVVVDAALLLEVDIPFKIDCIIALKCPKQEQIRRLKDMGMKEEEITLRLQSQSHLQKSFHKADLVLDTGKNKEAVFSEIETVVEGILKENADH